MSMKTVLITGATGDVGTHRPRLRAIQARLSDKRRSGKISSKPISRWPTMRITKGVDAIVHLGSYSVEGRRKDPAGQHHRLLQRCGPRGKTA
jgi:hypothetical protein